MVLTVATVKVMTFNLRVMVLTDRKNAWNRRYPAAAEAIRSGQADIVCTQEGRYSMLRDLEPLIGPYAWFGEGRKGGHEDEHCAIFYNRDRWSLAESDSFSLSEQPGRLGTLSWKTNYPRMCTWGRFRSAAGGEDAKEEFAVFNTHLDHISAEAQEKGMELIRERMASFGSRMPLPTILTGDFNVEPDHAVIRELERHGYQSAYSALPPAAGSLRPGRTFHGFHGGIEGEPIDYIYVTPEVQVREVLVDRQRYDGRFPSDHYPVTSVLAWGRDAGVSP